MMSFTMDSGIELMSENSTMDGSFLTDTWEYMKVRRKVEGQKKPARERTNVEEWKIRGRREGGQRMSADGQTGKEGERISVEVEMHNLKLEDLQKIERKKEDKTQETAIKDTIYMIESPQDSSSGIASDDHHAPSSSMPGSQFSTSFLDSELSDDHVTASPSHQAPSTGHYKHQQRAGAASLSSQHGSNRVSSDPESFTQDESDTGVTGQGYSSRGVSGYGYHARHHDNKPRSRVPLSPKVTIKDSQQPTAGAGAVANRTSHLNNTQKQLQAHRQQGQGQGHPQGHSQGHFQDYTQQPLYHISEQQQHPLMSYPQSHHPHQNPQAYPPNPHQNQKQPRTRDPHTRNSYVNVQLNGYHHPDYGYTTQEQLYQSQNGYTAQQQLGLPNYDDLYPAYPYKGYTLEETERLIQQAKKKNKLSYFDLLPDDVMIRIFGNLSSEDVCRSARVSRRWYSLAWDPALWTAVRLNDPGLDVDRALKQLTKRLSYDTPTVCVMVERINLNGCELLTDKGLNTIARRCPELRQLECQGCPNITNIAMFEVVSRCVNLEHLNVAGCPCINCICLTPEATVQATAFGKQIFLRFLDMTDCYALDDAGLQIIASYCSQLVHLYLRRCSRVTDIGVQYVANYCSQLREFSISDCKKVTDFGMRELSKLEGNLRYLSVAKCDQVSDVGIKYIARYCHKLRYLNVRGCEGVSDDSIEMVARNCKRLKSLDIGKCDVTDDVLQVIANHCPQLRKLSVKSCDAITDAGIIAIANQCPQLQQLNIQDCQISVEAYRIVRKSCKRCIIEHTNPGFY